MASSEMQRQSARNGRLANAALTYDKSQLSHRWVLPQRTRKTQFHRKGRKERKELFGGVWGEEDSLSGRYRNAQA